MPKDIFVQVQDNASGIAGDDRRMLLDLLDVGKALGAEANSMELVFQ